MTSETVTRGNTRLIPYGKQTESGANMNAPDKGQPTEADAVCELGRPLGECQLRRAGCGSLYNVLVALYPPSTLLAELRNQQNLDHDVAQWLKRLEGIGAIRYEPSRRTDAYNRRSE